MDLVNHHISSVYFKCILLMSLFDWMKEDEESEWVHSYYDLMRI